MNRLRPVAGKAGQTTATGASSASSSASATGPMFPAGVESNVEQYLKRNCLQPWRFSQSSASRLRETASSAATERVLRATTPARSEEHTSELQSLMRISSAVFCLKKKNDTDTTPILHI